MAWLMAEELQERSFLVVFGQHGLHLNMLGHQEEIERIQDVLNIHHGAGPVLDEFIYAGTPIREDASRDCKDFTPLLQGAIRCNECTTFFWRFHHQYAKRFVY